MSLLEIKKLALNFGTKTIVQDLSFSLNKGDYLHIIGRNGAGKSSLVKAILGLITTQKGEILLENKSISSYSPLELAKKIAYLAQISEPVPFTVAELLLLGTYAKEHSFLSLTKLKADSYAQKIIELTQISEFLDRPIQTLSGGERQRAYLASALIQRPEILLLDEASNFLDSWHEESLFSLLNKINQEEKLTIISVSHNLEQVSKSKSKLLILDEQNYHFYEQASSDKIQAWTENAKQVISPAPSIKNNHLGLKFTLLALLTCLTLFGSSLLGISPETLSMAWINPLTSPEEWNIFINIRLARVLAAFSAGLGLSLVGMAFQALFRNPLASPFTLGISSGAAFGSALGILVPISVGFGFFSGLFAYSSMIFAFLGAIAVMLIVWNISRRNFHSSNASLLLAGVAANFFFSSLLMLLQYLADLSGNYRITRMLMGSLDGLGLENSLILALCVFLCSAPFLFMSPELDLLLLGEDEAKAKGANMKIIRLLIFILSSIVVAVVVAFCGPIGFVGMMSPHICRLIFGQRHKILAPSAALFGGLFLTMSDTFARLAIAPAEIPVGVITSVIGAPIFFYLLRKQN